MRIEDDDREVSSKRRSDIIKQIQQYQEQQEQQEQSEAAKAGLDASRLDRMSTQELLEQLDKVNQIEDGSLLVHQAEDARQMETRQDVQSGVQAHDVARIEQTRDQVTGAERTAEAVDTANKQQDRGESWQKFASDDSEREIPKSLAEVAHQERQAELQREESETISARELQNDMMVQMRKIRS